jgi:hypothetical protein
VKLNFLIPLICGVGFVPAGAQTWNTNYVQSLTEGPFTGYRISDANLNKYGDIGAFAVDLSRSDVGSTNGATGNGSLASGYNTSASGTFSTALGSYTEAQGYQSMAGGAYSIALGTASLAIGESAEANGDVSVALGSGATTDGLGSVAIGYAVWASGDKSAALGENTISSDYGSMSIGTFNSSNSAVSTNGNAVSFDLDNVALVIGNGTDVNTRSDAFVVRFNGNATLAGDLTLNSDARLKCGIESLGSTLEGLQRLDGKTYTFERDPTATRKIGLLAQDVEAVFPELVVSDDEGILSVNYQGLIPVLINALNEQTVRIERLEREKAQMSNALARVELLELWVQQLALSQSQQPQSIAVQ